MRMRYLLLFVLLWKISSGQQPNLTPYNVVWNSQSKHAGESMPCGGGDIGLNVWVEADEVFFYVARSGTFDENNALLKLGRVRLQLQPNPFHQGTFKQELDLATGTVMIEGHNRQAHVQMKIWVDVFQPIVHVDVKSNLPTSLKATYENWRYRDRVIRGKENNGNSYKWAPPEGFTITKKDSVSYENTNRVLFFHRNNDRTVFDVAVKQQGLVAVQEQLLNPLAGLTFGGLLEGQQMHAAEMSEGKYLGTDYKGWSLISNKPIRQHQISLYLHTAQTASVEAWRGGLEQLAANKHVNQKASLAWWKNFWNRSFIYIKPQAKDTSDVDWKMGRNYQLFRYMLACNVLGAYPTKFNGGLFTYDPLMVDTTMRFTPDFRNWGGGTFTAQNQRLVYWPMLRSGDFDLMLPAFAFYNRLLANAELRSKVYWGHAGASFTEQLENFGLPNPAEYGWKRPPDFDPGMQYNAWLEYQWDTVLEFCMMILETYRYQQKDIHEYLPLIEGSLQFFDAHYQYMAKRRGRKALDGAGHLVLYPGSAAETYKMTYNANSTIAALKTVTRHLLALPDSLLPADRKAIWSTFLSRIPPLNFRKINGRDMLAPAKLWERVNNTESPQLYPVFPWGMYGVGLSGLDTAINTYRYDPDVLKFRSHIGWKQDNIFAARLGLTQEALRLNRLKLTDGGRRFPAFWGPGFDWVPDHNWGGSGMIGLQEMLLQTVGEKIYVLPAWPLSSDVEFKLHAPQQTTVYVKVAQGKIEQLKVEPVSRQKDVVLPEKK